MRCISPNPDDFVLTITTCDFNGSSATGSADTINFYTCSGGPYCAMADSPETEAVFGHGEIRDLVFLDDVEPTTLVISKPVGNDGWCVNGIQWQGVDMLAPTTVLYFDISDGNTGNCVGGLLDYTDEDNEYFEENLVYPCLEEWRIFNLQGDADYEYELKVQGCDGVDTTPVTVSYCPDKSCSTADVVTQTLTAFGSGMTTFPVQLDFNPAAMQFLASGSDVWCADALSFNQFDLAENYSYSLEPGKSSTVTNLQVNGIAPTPAPTPAPTTPSGSNSTETLGDDGDDNDPDSEAQLGAIVGGTVAGVLAIVAVIAAVLFKTGRLKTGAGRRSTSSADDAVRTLPGGSRPTDNGRPAAAVAPVTHVQYPVAYQYPEAP
ncbi:unnamed protein product [Ectocarpus sp. CCAP 1310/34]|nr:unnamed protein product [Ectocarpus sp. CCAP 1310/34]